MDDCANSAEGIANLFATHFQTAFSNKEFKIKSQDNVKITICDISNIVISKNVILSVLKNIKVSTSTGPDNISPLFLSKCAENLVEPLYLIYNKSLQLGCFPAAWKVSDVVPIFKTGDRGNIVNYRPVSIIPGMAKIFEEIVNRYICTATKNILSRNQHGFQIGKSTITNLALFADYINKSFENYMFVDCVFIDFKSAFDRVEYSILINKLSELGIADPLLRWLKSYLTDRFQKVRIKGKFSTQYKVY